MLSFQFVAKAKLFVLSCLLCSTGIALGMFMPGYAQHRSFLRQTPLVQPEYGFTKRGGVFRVDAGGNFSSYGLNSRGEFYNYWNNPDLLRVSPNGSMIYIGGQQYMTSDSKEKTFIETYRLFPNGAIRLIGSFAHGTSNDYPSALAFGAKGRFLYLLTVHEAVNKNYFSDLSTYRCDSLGRVTQLAGSKPRIAAPSLNRADMISDPTGRFVYITQPDNRTIKQYRVSANGLLKPLSPTAVSLPQTPSTLVFPPGTPFLYVVSAKDNSLTQLRMSANGTLQMSHFFRFGSVKRTIDPILAISPNGRFLYVADDTLPVTRQFAIGADGALQPLSPPTAAFSPNYIAVDLTNRFAYLVDNGVANQQLIYPYRISPTGSLVRIKGDPASGVYPESLTFAQPR